MFNNLFFSSSSSIFCEIVTIVVCGNNIKYLPVSFICVVVLAPFLSLLSFWTCTSIFWFVFTTSFIFGSSFVIIFSSICGIMSFTWIKLFFSVPISTNAACIPGIISFIIPEYIFPSFLSCLHSSLLSYNSTIFPFSITAIVSFSFFLSTTISIILHSFPYFNYICSWHNQFRYLTNL